MKNSEEILGNKTMWKLILTMSIPAILAQLVNLLYSIVDRIYIGKMEVIGTDALAGLGLCTPIIILISSFSSFVGGGGAPLAARALGEKRKERAEKILGNGFTLLIIFSVTLGMIAYIFRKPLLHLVGASEITYGYANDYLSIYLIGTIFAQISVGLNAFISAQGKSKLAMCSVLIGAVLNIGLDPLFIFAFDMQIKGAALATIISQFVSASFVLFVLFDKNTSLKIKFSMMKLDGSILLAIFTIGIAPFVMSATESVIGFVLNGRLKFYGGDIYVSALTVLQSAMMLISTPISGFTQGVTPILSYNFGAGNKKRLSDCFKLTLLICFSYCSLFALIMMLFPHMFGLMFTDDASLLAITDKYLGIFVAGMLVFGIQRACQTTFVAIGEARISLFIAILRKILLLVPFAFIFPIFMGVGGVYWAECIADATAATICGTIFFFRFRKVLNKMDNI